MELAIKLSVLFMTFEISSQYSQRSATMTKIPVDTLPVFHMTLDKVSIAECASACLTMTDNTKPCRGFVLQVGKTCRMTAEELPSATGNTTAKTTAYAITHQYLDDTHATQTEANVYCQSRGLSLTIPDTLAKGKEIVTRYLSTGSIGCWTGLIYNALTDAWGDAKRDDIVQRSSHLWSPGEPNNKWGNESCVEILPSGYLNDKNCLKKLPFACE